MSARVAYRDAFEVDFAASHAEALAGRAAALPVCALAAGFAVLTGLDAFNAAGWRLGALLAVRLALNVAIPLGEAAMLWVSARGALIRDKPGKSGMSAKCGSDFNRLVISEIPCLTAPPTTHPLGISALEGHAGSVRFARSCHSPSMLVALFKLSRGRLVHDTDNHSQE